MSETYRKTTRFPDFGRVEAPELSLLPGILEDISLGGCRVRFPLSIAVDTDNDYELKIRPSRKRNSVPFLLLCHPQWCQETDCGTEIGFQILRSPDTARLNEYISLLDEENSNSDTAEDSSFDQVCQFG